MSKEYDCFLGTLELPDQLLVWLIVNSDALHHKKRLLVGSILLVTSIPASFHELIVAFRISNDSSGVAATMLLNIASHIRIPNDSSGIAATMFLNIASHFSVAQSYLIVALNSERDSQLIIALHLCKLLDDPFTLVGTPASSHDLIVASRFPFDSFSVASFQLIVALHSSVASSVVALHDYLDTSSVSSIKLIVVSNLVDKVSLFPYSNCTALCEGVMASKLIIDWIWSVSEGVDCYFKVLLQSDFSALYEGDSDAFLDLDANRLLIVILVERLAPQSIVHTFEGDSLVLPSFMLIDALHCGFDFGCADSCSCYKVPQLSFQ